MREDLSTSPTDSGQPLQGTSIRPGSPSEGVVPAGSPGSPTAGSAAPMHAIGGWSGAAVSDRGQSSAPAFGRSGEQLSTSRVKVLGIGAGTLTTLGAAVGGAWAYSRWQHERNKPINRMRRRLRGVAQNVGERLPDRDVILDRLPDAEVARPVGGGGVALLLAALLVNRALRGWRDEPGVPESIADKVVGDRRIKDALADLQTRWSTMHLPESLDTDAARKRGGALLLAARERASVVDLPPRGRSLGLGGILAAGAVFYVVWRVLNQQAGDDSAARGNQTPS